MDQQALVEYRYRAVREVLGGSPIGEVAARYWTSRQSVHALRQHLTEFGTGPEGCVFAGVRGGELSTITYRQAWDRARTVPRRLLTHAVDLGRCLSE